MVLPSDRPSPRSLRGKVSRRKASHAVDLWQRPCQTERPMLPKGFLELARTLIGANTVSSQGTRQAADLLQALWEHAGLPVRRQVVEEVHVNILGGPGFEVTGEVGLQLVTRLDTVPPGPLGSWQSDPWLLTDRAGF